MNSTLVDGQRAIFLLDEADFRWLFALCIIRSECGASSTTERTKGLIISASMSLEQLQIVRLAIELAVDL